MRTDAGSVSMGLRIRRRAPPGPAADPRPGTPGRPAPDGPRRGGFRSRPRSRRPSSPGARDGSALAPAGPPRPASSTRRSAGRPARGTARTQPERLANGPPASTTTRASASRQYRRPTAAAMSVSLAIRASSLARPRAERASRKVVPRENLVRLSGWSLA